jgi:lysozyme
MKYNRGDVQGAADEFVKWNKSGGRILPGLTRRRLEEQALFLS